MAELQLESKPDHSCPFSLMKEKKTPRPFSFLYFFPFFKGRKKSKEKDNETQFCSYQPWLDINHSTQAAEWSQIVCHPHCSQWTNLHWACTLPLRRMCMRSTDDSYEFSMSKDYDEAICAGRSDFSLRPSQARGRFENRAKSWYLLRTKGTNARG
jgi:hypothetical protein